MVKINFNSPRNNVFHPLILVFCFCFYGLGNPVEKAVWKSCKRDWKQWVSSTAVSMTTGRWYIIIQSVHIFKGGWGFGRAEGCWNGSVGVSSKGQGTMPSQLSLDVGTECAFWTGCACLHPLLSRALFNELEEQSSPLSFVHVLFPPRLLIAWRVTCEQEPWCLHPWVPCCLWDPCPCYKLRWSMSEILTDRYILAVHQ